MEDTHDKNHGLRTEAPKTNDYYSGVASGIEYQERMPSGSWRAYRGIGERQRGMGPDLMACVSFSANNAIEEQVNWLIATHEVTPEQYSTLVDNGFIDGNDQLNLSDIALAYLSATSETGNSLSWVGINARHYAIPESAWPFNTEAKTWAEAYKKILTDEEIKKYSDIFFSIFSIQTEFIDSTLSSIRKHLKQAPLQIASATCPGWFPGNDVISACGRNSNHATLIDEASDYLYDFDHYEPYGKRLALDYQIDCVLKYVVTIKKEQKPMLNVKENFLYQLVERHGGFALGLGGKLIVDDEAKILSSFIVRNNGDIKGKCIAVNQKDWDSVPHFNLKGERL